MDPRLYDAAAIASGFVPGSGLMDFIGQAPAIGGGMGPSFMENLKKKQYVDAMLQMAGAAGDALMVVPPVGMTVKAATTAGKTARAGGNIADEILAKYGDTLVADIFDGKNVELSRLIVPKGQRQKGLGTAFMEDLVSAADREGRTVTLSPSSDFGGNKTRLEEFYKRFGFVQNKGRNKDFTISNTMYRLPREK